MIEPVPTTQSGVLHLRTGQKLGVTMGPGYWEGLKPISYTDQSVRQFSSDHGSKYLVQGDNIAYLEVK